MRKLALYIATFSLAVGPAIFLNSLPASSTSPGPFQNGSFEDGTANFDSGGHGACYSANHCYSTLASVYNNEGVMPGWTVTAGSVDWIDGWWPAQDGSYSIDMNGTVAQGVSGAGTLAQTFTTVAGATYDVSFYMAGNNDSLTSTTIMKLDVQASDNSPQTYSFDTYGHDYVNMGWTLETYQFIASSDTTTLTFTSDMSPTSNAGPALDNVTISQPYASSGAECKDGGYASLYNPNTNAPFRNQGACVSYMATAGDTPIGS